PATMLGERRLCGRPLAGRRGPIYDRQAVRIHPGASCAPFSRKDVVEMAHELPPLPYAFNALEPFIDDQTVQIHDGKHHQANGTNPNAALDTHPERHRKTIEQLIADIDAVPEDIRTAVRNNGGGHLNHTFFWQIMGP